MTEQYKINARSGLVEELRKQLAVKDESLKKAAEHIIRLEKCWQVEASENIKLKRIEEQILNNEELNLIREWFNVCEDCNNGYLEPKDYALYNKIQQKLGNKIRPIHKESALEYDRLRRLDENVKNLIQDYKAMEVCLNKTGIIASSPSLEEIQTKLKVLESLDNE